MDQIFKRKNKIKYGFKKIGTMYIKNITHGIIEWLNKIKDIT